MAEQSIFAANFKLRKTNYSKYLTQSHQFLIQTIDASIIVTISSLQMCYRDDQSKSILAELCIEGAS